MHVPNERLLLMCSTVLVGYLTESSASKSKPFMISIVIMLISTLVFFLGTTPAMIILSRAIQGVSATFTWVTGLAFLVSQVGEGDLGEYVGWTTVGIAIGEVAGPIVGGPVYDYLGYWWTFGIVQGLLLIDVLLRVLVKEKRGVAQDTEARVEQDPETARLLQDEQVDSSNYDTTPCRERETKSIKGTASSLAWNWLGTVFALTTTFMVRGALDVVS